MGTTFGAALGAATIVIFGQWLGASACNGSRHTHSEHPVSDYHVRTRLDELLPWRHAAVAA